MTGRGVMQAIDVLNISRADEVNNTELRARADHEWRVWTSGIVASVDGSEAGLLMLDFLNLSSTAKVHVILVLERFRQRGIGRMLLEHAEAAARRMGATSMSLDPYPLDERTELAALRRWYSSMGFNGVRDSREMKKSLVAWSSKST